MVRKSNRDIIKINYGMYPIRDDIQGMCWGLSTLQYSSVDQLRTTLKLKPIV